jgi:glycine betaine catabolism B
MKLKLVKVRDEAKGTRSFFWEPEKHIKYLPGQFYYFTLPRLLKSDSRGPTRHFTLSSSPTESESDGLIRFTTRMRKQSGYKISLYALKKGDIVEGEGPNGTFILDENASGRHVFIAGGIGVTPFRSIMKYLVDKDLRTSDIQLVYSNSVPEEIAFKRELESWCDNRENMTVDMTITKPGNTTSKWYGLEGRIDKGMLRRLISDPQNLTYWLCGPPPMIDAMEVLLKNINVPSSRVISEKFTGY